MKILGIDTSSKFLSIALSENKDIIREESHLLDRNHSSELVPRIKELLRKSAVPIGKIDAFVVGLGPGSFTGLRIGVSAIKGFGVALKKPCVGVPSIDSIACNVMAEDKEIVPIIDAKRQQVYAAIYRRKGGRVIRESGYLLLTIEKLMKKLNGDVVFLGDGISLYKDALSGIKQSADFLEEKYWYPAAGNIIKLGFSRIKKTKNTGLDKLEPLYLYPKDCQVRKSKSA